MLVVLKRYNVAGETINATTPYTEFDVVESDWV